MELVVGLVGCLIWAGLIGPGQKFGTTAAPLFSLSCNENRAKILKGPNLPGLAESCLLCRNSPHLIASKRSVAASQRCDLL
ncbi:Cell division FtsZ [Gossypium arboreum]|uniref:Cell division FtsZ n=1 Tax=Gossypium arboreum TaxID=29729 RepID=A0A0B0PTJ3_GOSAR|nr:Cell division FtsZ [Gossypium arboreum]